MSEFSGNVAASLWLICTCLSAIGCLYGIFAAACAAKLRRSIAAETTHAAPAATPGSAWPSVSILKPLYGAEPELLDHLSSFVDQAYPGPFEIVLGVQNPVDPAVAVVAELQRRHPKHAIRLVSDSTIHGANRKVSNLINIRRAAQHEVLVQADSDMRVAPDYLRRVVSALRRPGVGLVTCLYRGLPVAGPWSRLSAMAIDYHFLPSVLVGMQLGLAKPCFGSTIALEADTLARIGGFEAFRDQLADDYAMGAAVRGLGLEVAVPPMVVAHACTEGSAGELFRHELRWQRTIRLVDPVGFAGSIVTHPVPLALLAAPFAAFAAPWAGASATWVFGSILLALACRLLVQIQVDRALHVGHSRLAWGPARDALSFAIFVAAFLPGRLTWRGASFGVRNDGTMTET